MNHTNNILKTMLCTVIITMLSMVFPLNIGAQQTAKYISELCIAAYDGEGETAKYLTDRGYDVLRYGDDYADFNDGCGSDSYYALLGIKYTNELAEAIGDLYFIDNEDNDTRGHGDMYSKGWKLIECSPNSNNGDFNKGGGGYWIRLFYKKVNPTDRNSHPLTSIAMTKDFNAGNIVRGNDYWRSWFFGWDNEERINVRINLNDGNSGDRLYLQAFYHTHDGDYDIHQSTSTSSFIGYNCSNDNIHGCHLYNLKGAGTEESPIEIGNADVLFQVMNIMQTSARAKSLHYKLTADIDCFYAGLSVFLSNTFKGTLDGNGHALVNLRNTGDMSNRSVSLFQNIEGATIKNLTIRDAAISVKDKGSILISGGILCDKALNSTIENCHIVGGSFYHGVGDGTDSSVFGALVGKATNSTIQHCSSSLSILPNADGDANEGLNTAGLVGMLSGSKMTSCIVYGDKLELCNYPLVCEIKSHSTHSTLKDCYALKGKLKNENATDCRNFEAGSTIEYCDYVSESNVSSGRAAWLLNGKEDAGFWHQKLSEDGDKRPNTLQHDYTKVYRVHKDIGCDGKAVSDVYIYTNDPNSTRAAHNMTFYPEVLDVPTCLHPQNFNYWYCDKCHKYYRNAEGTEDSEFTPAEPKNHAEMIKYERKFDCIQGTVIAHWYCPECDNSFSQNYVDTDNYFICKGHYVTPSPYTYHLMEFVPESTNIGALNTCLNKNLNQAHWHCRRCNGNFTDEEGKYPLSNTSKPHSFTDEHHAEGGYFFQGDKTALADGTQLIFSEDKLAENKHAFVPEHWYCPDCHHFSTSANNFSDADIVPSPIQTAEHEVKDAGTVEGTGVHIMQCVCGYGKYFVYDAGRETITVELKENTTDVFVANSLDFTLNAEGKTLIIGSDIILEALNATFKEAWTKGRKWGTKCLPFCFKPSENTALRFYRMKSIVLDTEPAGIMLQEIKDDELIPAGTPLFVKAINPDMENYTITAHNTYICTTAENRGVRIDDACRPFFLKGAMENFVFDTQKRNTNGYYISADKLWHATSKFNVKPYRAYIENSSKDADGQAAAKSFVLMIEDNSGATSVEGIATFETDGELNVKEIYDINGRRVTKPMADKIYIIKTKHGNKKVTR